MEWYKLATNPRAISEIYTNVPSLEGIRLNEVRFYEDGPRITFFLDIRTFPENVPARWKQRRYNALSLQLDFWMIESVQILKWSKENIVNVSIKQTTEKRIEVQAISSTCHIQLIAYAFSLVLHKRVQAVE